MTLDPDALRALKSLRRSRERRFWMPFLLAITTVVTVVWVACERPGGHGDPDPGGRLLTALRPVAAAVPAGVAHVHRQFVEPSWDSCDGIASTFGWDDVTVDISFDSNGMSDTVIAAHIGAALATRGWAPESSSEIGAWYWTRTLSPGHSAEIQLLGGSTVDPPNPWDLQATTPAATHPVQGC